MRIWRWEQRAHVPRQASASPCDDVSRPIGTDLVEGFRRAPTALGGDDRAAAVKSTAGVQLRNLGVSGQLQHRTDFAEFKQARLFACHKQRSGGSGIPHRRCHFKQATLSSTLCDGAASPEHSTDGADITQTLLFGGHATGCQTSAWRDQWDERCMTGPQRKSQRRKTRLPVFDRDRNYCLQAEESELQ
ncbi:hypothetical protein HPB47_013376 [Ixodes persulcatus]|uniref:Uncharacterized protein n=1 Tax=Ixodes persulcatus TaxID=34615 RepID=A0AC60QYM8_IXOPE|nr:hypothetical protein HPB47_013376 [Ixodes persulcatus]